MIAALLVVFMIAWASPSEAWSGHGRSAHKNQSTNGKKIRGVHGYHHYHPRPSYYHYGYRYKPDHFRYGHYSNLGLLYSPHGTRVHVSLGF
jgi:hypothetical protein